MKPGYDLLGAAHPKFPFKEIIRDIDVDCPIGWFWEAFGPSKHLFQEMLNLGFRTFRIQAFWDDNHALVPVDTLKRILREIKEVSGDAASLSLYISPSCEHKETNRDELVRRLEMVRDIIPHALPVNNPWQGIRVAGYLTEKHGGLNIGPCELASTDGTNIYDINAARWVKTFGNREHPCFLWGSRFNLREIPDPGQKPPPRNKREAAPSMQYFRSIKRLAEPPGAAPSASFTAQAFKAPAIWKTHAEDSQEPREGDADNPRENRPVLILPGNVPAVDIITRNNKLLGKLPKYGTFSNGLYRYYSGIPGGIGLYGFQIGRQAKEESGSEFVWFRAGKRIYGPVHPAFRAGVYRT